MAQGFYSSHRDAVKGQPHGLLPARGRGRQVDSGPCKRNALWNLLNRIR